ILSNTARVSGGGINLLRTSSVVEANTIQGNVVEEQDGGGIALWSDQSTVHDNTIQNNQADDFGAGIVINKNLFDDEGSVVIITYNTIANNHAPNGTGAAITLLNSDATIQHNTVISNSSQAAWVALLANKCNLTLSDNLFQGNTNIGAGFSVQDTAAILRCQATLDNNQFVGNVNHSNGSVLKVSASSVSGQNNIIAGNSAPGQQIAGLKFYSATATLRHTTIAHNNGMQSFGINLDGETLNQVTLQNTIVASHTAGVHAFDPQGITMDGVLWYSVTQQTHEDAVITASHAYTGSPAFANPAALDFHITGASAARDRGIDAGVSGDIDGDPRPLGAAPDLGADEYTGPPVISDLRVVQGQVTTATVTVALAWTPPAEAISTTIRYNIG
ncbi:MAG: hypothetical protein GY832_16510, partial [Chloroflexi bacterium]|nr:hypothetical protein [Chloroflexota bacterium]